MMKEKLRLEYSLKNVSLPILWTCISTPTGLGTWFSEKATVKGSVYKFEWNKSSQEAELIMVRNLSYVRFHWLDDDFEDSYFELRIEVSEMTGQAQLEIEDYSLMDDPDDVKKLWDSQVDLLKRKLGVI